MRNASDAVEVDNTKDVPVKVKFGDAANVLTPLLY